MDVRYLSTTLIKNYPICGVRALDGHLKRLEEGDGEWGSNPTRFGTVVHDVAEEMHQLDMKGKTADPMQLFDKHWRLSNLSDFDYYEFGRETIAEFIDRTLYNRNGVTIATEFGFILDLVDGGVWPTADMSKSEFDKTCAKIVKKGGVPVASKIDRIDRLPDGSLEIFDYKTNRQPFTRSEVDNSEQLFIYDMAARSLYPDAPDITCIFDMLRHGRFRTRFSDEKREAIRNFIINLWHQIKKDTIVEPQLNTFCSWCEIKENCQVYAAALIGDINHPAASPDEMTDAEMWNAYDKLQIVAKLAKERADAFKEVIIAKVIDEGPIPIDDTYEMSLIQNPRYEYPILDVFSVLKKRGAISLLTKCASISKPSLEKAIRGRVELQSEIAPLLQKTFAKPTLKKRKKNTTGEEESDVEA